MKCMPDTSVVSCICLQSLRTIEIRQMSKSKGIRNAFSLVLSKLVSLFLPIIKIWKNKIKLAHTDRLRKNAHVCWQYLYCKSCPHKIKRICRRGSCYPRHSTAYKVHTKVCTCSTSMIFPNNWMQQLQNRRDILNDIMQCTKIIYYSTLATYQFYFNNCRIFRKVT